MIHGEAILDCGFNFEGFPNAIENVGGRMEDETAGISMIESLWRLQ